ncbi:MAG: protein adenylyltransferase SelO [Roseibacillus sp.]
MPNNPIPFQNTYAKLPEKFYAKQPPSKVPSPQLIATNSTLATELGIDPNWLTTPEALAVFSGNTIAPGSEPLAQAYAGHQFGGFSPQLGDGRALLLGEVPTANGPRDIQLKGSGRTPFSRQGDGKSALGPVLREYLVSEAMHALGVPTTRALAAVSTGETVYRQEGHVMGGVFTRVAASHLRVGTFQYFAAREDHDALRTLADYTINRHYPEAANAPNSTLALLESVITAQAQLIPHWMSLGFIHGVMNTDNCALSGETIDYGPCAFMEEFHPQCVFSSIDRDARYSWGNQPNIGLWNLSRFAETLLPLLDPELDKAKTLAEDALEGYAEQFGSHYHSRFCAKLGIPSETDPDLIRSSLELLANQQVDFTLFFRHLTRHAANEPNGESDLLSLFDNPESAQDWLALWKKVTHDQPNLTQMRAANPIRIPRNHRVEEVIQAGYRGDFAPFQTLQAALAHPFEESEKFAPYETRPTPDQVVTATFCGT